MTCSINGFFGLYFHNCFLEASQPGQCSSGAALGIRRGDLRLEQVNLTVYDSHGGTWGPPGAPGTHSNHITMPGMPCFATPQAVPAVAALENQWCPRGRL